MENRRGSFGFLYLLSSVPLVTSETHHPFATPHPTKDSLGCVCAGGGGKGVCKNRMGKNGEGGLKGESAEN